MAQLYCFSLLDEYYILGASTVKETLKMALNEAEEDNFNNGILKVHVGKVRYYNDDDLLDFRDVIEKMQEIAYDEWGDYAEYYLDLIQISKEDLEWAQKEFLKLWKKFKKRTKNEDAFYFAEDVVTYEIDRKGNIIFPKLEEE